MSGWSSSIRRRLQALRTLRGPAEAVLLLRLIALGALMRPVSRLPLARIESMLQLRTPSGDSSGPNVERVAALVDLALSIGWPLVPRGCLPRGLILCHELRRRGLDVSLAFGVGSVTRDDPTGHCWLVQDGEPLLERTDPRMRYVETYRFRWA